MVCSVRSSTALDWLRVATLFEQATVWFDQGVWYVLLFPEEASGALDPLEGRPVVCPADPLARDVPLWAGVLPYEAFRSGLERSAWSVAEKRAAPPCAQIEWRRFAAAVVIAASGESFVVADSQALLAEIEARLLRADSAEGASARAEPPLEPLPRLSIVESEPAELHRDRVRAAVARIREGEFYQVNLARQLTLQFAAERPADYARLLARLTQEFPAPFRFLFHTREGATVVGASPELALCAKASADGTRFAALETIPIKGTRARGKTAEEDARLLLELETDEKERAELAMIVDVERNDLNRVCEPGSVQRSAVRSEAHSTVFHRVSTVSGRCREELSRADVLRALLPSGSVTGAPKVRAMEVIAELETARRGLYTGAVGVLTRAGDLRLSMAIRTMVFERNGAGNYWVGGGIVVDSDADREFEETRWKAAQVFSLQKITM
jgi:para-aminobenzoate synthetase component 1